MAEPSARKAEFSYYDQITAILLRNELAFNSVETYTVDNILSAYKEYIQRFNMTGNFTLDLFIEFYKENINHIKRINDEINNLGFDVHLFLSDDKEDCISIIFSVLKYKFAENIKYPSCNTNRESTIPQWYRISDELKNFMQLENNVASNIDIVNAVFCHADLNSMLIRYKPCYGIRIDEKLSQLLNIPIGTEIEPDDNFINYYRHHIIG